jgi:predicted GH43/DUF377 family glycosyl hydrolase
MRCRRLKSNPGKLPGKIATAAVAVHRPAGYGGRHAVARTHRGRRESEVSDAGLEVVRLPAHLVADPRRVLARPFRPGEPRRVHAIVERVRALSDAQVATMLRAILADYGARHRDIRGVFLQNSEIALASIDRGVEPSEERRLLAGAYFTNEYSLESAALFNPSMVVHPDASDVPRGSTRFVMSLRACGEGHISSIEFRSGLVGADCSVVFDPLTRFALTATERADTRYHKHTFILKLVEMAADQPCAEAILELLASEFTTRELKDAIERRRPGDAGNALFEETASQMLWLARSNYELDFRPNSELSERVIYPVTENESRGIEDARFVRFTYPDGEVLYYATYTAYNGFHVLPQLIRTADFRHFKVSTLNGRCVQNKGMALFPRKIGDDYVMASRLDGENIYLMRSENIHFWNEAKLVREPKFPWELVQVGNCGSPIETEKGWVLLTHGVGPMRQYWMGALLLDLEDPSRVLGELAEPILMPDPAERDGYVPNVVYSCGAMRHGDRLIIPYAIADSHIRIATVSLPELLAQLTR